MRQLKRNETARYGDWFLYLDPNPRNYLWVRLDSNDMPAYRETIGQLEDGNKSPHYPIIIMRPTPEELEAKTQPKPYELNRKQVENFRLIRRRVKAYVRNLLKD